MSSSDKKYNICITTYFDKKYKSFGKLCLKSIEKYAKKYKYDVKILNCIHCTRPANWHKLQIVQELFKQKYDFILWIDADAIFIRFDEDIVFEIEADKDLYLVKYSDEKGESPNTGIFLIRNSHWSKMVLENVWNLEKYTNHIWAEQAALLEFFGLIGSLKEYNPHFRETNLINKNPDLELLKKVKWLNMKWNDFLPSAEICLKWHNFLPKERIDSPIIRHYAGLPNHIRLYYMLLDAEQVGIASKLTRLTYMLEYHKTKMWFDIKNIHKTYSKPKKTVNF